MLIYGLTKHMILIWDGLTSSKCFTELLYQGINNDNDVIAIIIITSGHIVLYRTSLRRSHGTVRRLLVVQHRAQNSHSHTIVDAVGALNHQWTLVAAPRAAAVGSTHCLVILLRSSYAGART